MKIGEKIATYTRQLQEMQRRPRQSLTPYDQQKIDQVDAEIQEMTRIIEWLQSELPYMETFTTDDEPDKGTHYVRISNRSGYDFAEISFDFNSTYADQTTETIVLKTENWLTTNTADLYFTPSKENLVAASIDVNSIEYSLINPPVHEAPVPQRPAEDAVTRAKSYLESSFFSRKGLISQLEYEGYSNQEAINAIQACNIDFKQQALAEAKDHLQSDPGMARDDLYSLLINGCDYEADEAQYAVTMVYSKPSNHKTREQKSGGFFRRLFFGQSAEKETADTPETVFTQSMDVPETPESSQSIVEQLSAIRGSIQEENIATKIQELENNTQKVVDRLGGQENAKGEYKRFIDHYLHIAVDVLDKYRNLQFDEKNGEEYNKMVSDVTELLDMSNTAARGLLDRQLKNDVIDAETDISALRMQLTMDGLLEEEK